MAVSIKRTVVEIPANTGNSQDTALIAAVESVVFASLQAMAKRMYALAGGYEAEDTPPLPIVVVKGDGWDLRLDVLDCFTREKREEIAALIAAAIRAAVVELPWFSMACCVNLDHARGFMSKNSPVGAITEYNSRLQKEVLEYLDAAEQASNSVSVLADRLASLGGHGAAMFATDEDKAVDALSLWFDPGAPGLCHYPTMLGEALWFDVIAPKLEREARNSRNPAALTLGNFDTVNRLMWHKNHAVTADNRQPELFVDDQLIATARVPDFALIDVLTAGTVEFRSYAGARMFVWVVEEVKRRHFMGVQYPNVLTIEGGLGALAESIGIGGSKSREALLRRILIAGQSWRVEWPDGREQGGLWTFSISPASRAARACVTITVSAPLTPYYDQRSILTPIVPIDDLDGITSKNYLGPLAAFKQSIMRELVEQRLEIAAHGGALIAERRLLSLAALVGLPPAAAIRAFNAWQVDRDEGERFLEVHRGRVHIAAGGEYQRIRDFVDATASIAKKASSRGKRSAAKKRKK